MKSKGSVKKVLFTKNFSVTAAQITSLAPTSYEVWASHTDAGHAMLAATPNTFLEPRGVKGDAYASWLLDMCRERGVDLVIPGKEREHLARWQGAFERAGVQLIVPGDEATQRHLDCKDEFLSAWDGSILSIPAWLTFHDLASFDGACADLYRRGAAQGLRLCMKPTRGLYASGFRVLVEHPDLGTFLSGELYQMSVQSARELFRDQTFPTMLLMHTLEGIERSVDCVAWKGELIRAVVRRKEGTSQHIEARPDLEQVAREIARRYHLSGIFNFQTKDDRDEVANMLEINARASGGLSLSMAAGVNFPLLLLDAATGTLDWNALPPVHTGLNVTEDRTARVIR